MIVDICLLLAGEFAFAVLVGYVVTKELDYRAWRRYGRRFGSPIVNTKPPTLTELNRPTWMEDAE